MEAKLDNFIASFEDFIIVVKNNFDLVFKKFDGIEHCLDRMDDRFNRIENILVGGHERRIENLEDRIRIIETTTGIRKN